MQVFFETRDRDAASLRHLAVNRARFVMRRLSALVPRATVTLEDINGPRGGIDKRCHVELKTEKLGTVVITATADNWRTALDKALGRAAQALRRMWQRERHPARLKALQLQDTQ